MSSTELALDLEPDTQEATVITDGEAYLLEVADLDVDYHGEPALAGVSLRLQRNRITALIGPSGCGKTTFLSCLNRLNDLVSGCCVDGEICFDGVDIHEAGTNLIALRRRVGMIFQKPNPFPLSIRRNLELPLRELGLKRDAVQATSERVLREVGLWEEVQQRLDSPAQALSGGQQQRLCIARAISLNPELLLMDEPCSALDPMSSGVVEDLIVRLREHYTVLIVTHNLAQAHRIADYTGFFWADDGTGRLVEFGATADIFERPQDARTRAYVEGRRG